MVDDCVGMGVWKGRGADASPFSACSAARVVDLRLDV